MDKNERDEILAMQDDEGKPDLVVAFPGGSGTADCVRRAKAAGVEVLVIRVAKEAKSA